MLDYNHTADKNSGPSFHLQEPCTVNKAKAFLSSLANQSCFSQYVKSAFQRNVEMIYLCFINCNNVHDNTVLYLNLAQLTVIQSQMFVGVL